MPVTFINIARDGTGFRHTDALHRMKRDGTPETSDVNPTTCVMREQEALSTSSESEVADDQRVSWGLQPYTPGTEPPTFAGDHRYSQYWGEEYTADELQQLSALGAMPLDPTGSAKGPPDWSQEVWPYEDPNGMPWVALSPREFSRGAVVPADSLRAYALGSFGLQTLATGEHVNAAGIVSVDGVRCAESDRLMRMNNARSGTPYITRTGTHLPRNCMTATGRSGQPLYLPRLDSLVLLDVVPPGTALYNNTGQRIAYVPQTAAHIDAAQKDHMYVQDEGCTTTWKPFKKDGRHHNKGRPPKGKSAPGEENTWDTDTQEEDTLNETGAGDEENSDEALEAAIEEALIDLGDEEALEEAIEEALIDSGDAEALAKAIEEALVDSAEEEDEEDTEENEDHHSNKRYRAAEGYP